MPEPYLYLFYRNDLPSMNPGKALAHAAHAANQAVFQIRNLPTATNSQSQILALLKQWEGERGFGTTISLSMNFDQMRQTTTLLDTMGFASGLTEDPSYPYETTLEIAKLILHPVEYPPIIRSATSVICFRRETTFGWAFGDKAELAPYLGIFPLVP